MPGAVRVDGRVQVFKDALPQWGAGGDGLPVGRQATAMRSPQRCPRVLLFVPSYRDDSSLLTLRWRTGRLKSVVRLWRDLDSRKRL